MLTLKDISIERLKKDSRLDPEWVQYLNDNFEYCQIAVVLSLLDTYPLYIVKKVAQPDIEYLSMMKLCTLWETLEDDVIDMMINAMINAKCSRDDMDHIFDMYLSNRFSLPLQLSYLVNKITFGKVFKSEKQRFMKSVQCFLALKILENN